MFLSKHAQNLLEMSCLPGKWLPFFHLFHAGHHLIGFSFKGCNGFILLLQSVLCILGKQGEGSISCPGLLHISALQTSLTVHTDLTTLSRVCHNCCSSLEPWKTNQVKAPALAEEQSGRYWGLLAAVSVDSAPEDPLGLGTRATSCAPSRALKGGIVSFNLLLTGRLREKSQSEAGLFPQPCL